MIISRDGKVKGYAWRSRFSDIWVLDLGPKWVRLASNGIDPGL